MFLHLLPRDKLLHVIAIPVFLNNLGAILQNFEKASPYNKDRSNKEQVAKNPLVHRQQRHQQARHPRFAWIPT